MAYRSSRALFYVKHYIYLMIGLHEPLNACDVLHIDMNLKNYWVFIF